MRPPSTCFSIRKCVSAREAICGRCVMHRICALCGQAVQFVGDGLRRAAADADIDLVEDHGRHGPGARP